MRDLIKHSSKFAIIALGSFAFLITNEASAQCYSAKLRASDDRAQLGFGIGVAINGGTIMSGVENGCIFTGTCHGPGTLHVYESTQVQTWEEAKVLTAPNKTVGSIGSHGIEIDGNFAVVSRYRSQSGDVGVYVLQRGVNGRWSELQRLEPSDGDQFSFFTVGLLHYKMM